MIPNPSRARYIAGVIVALMLAAIYVAALRHLALDTPPFDASGIQRQIDEIRARPGAPLEPLPVIPVFDATLLLMARDPFAPLEALDPEQTP